MRYAAPLMGLLLWCAALSSVAAPARVIAPGEVSVFISGLQASLTSRCGTIRAATAAERPALLESARGASPLPALHALGQAPGMVRWLQFQAPLDVKASVALFAPYCSAGSWVLGGAVDGATLGVALWSDDRPAWMSDGARREVGVQAALDAINLERVKGGRCGGQAVPPSLPLSVDRRLRQVILNYLAVQAKRPTGHRGADGSTPASRAGVLNVQEVLAYGVVSPQAAVAAWFASPSHCLALRDPSMRMIGLDYQLGGTHGVVWGALLAP